MSCPVLIQKSNWSPLFSNLSVDPTSGRGLGIGPNLIDQNSVSFTIVIKLKYMPMRAQVLATNRYSYVNQNKP